MNRKTCVIIGAGPAGLMAAHELLERTDVHPVIYEMTGDVGGISKTVECKGNRIDIGGHRFFSKSDRIMAWRQEILPLQGAPSRDDLVLGRKDSSRIFSSTGPVKCLSVSRAVRHAIRDLFFKDSSLSQKRTETSLIGQCWIHRLRKMSDM